MSSDDFSVYNGVIVGAQQKCLAHLRRHFKKVLQISHGNNTVVASAFLELIDEAFRQHREWRERRQELDYHTWARDFKTRLTELLLPLLLLTFPSISGNQKGFGSKTRSISAALPP